MKKYIEIGITILLLILLISLWYFRNNNQDKAEITTIYVATSSKEDFIKDKNIRNILLKKYNIKVVYDEWTNQKIISEPLIREYISLGNKDIIEQIKLGENITINTEGVSKYDALITSEEKYSNYYKNSPDLDNGEEERYEILDSKIILNTPIVIYSWKDIVNALINENIVNVQDGIYYITDMNKLINYILNSKSWSDIGLKDLYGNINISSVDPISSSLGSNYYGLLLSILNGGEINNLTIDSNLKKLKVFYQKSGYMINTPSDLFDRFLKTGMGEEPMIVDYEKSLLEFASSNKEGFNEIKDEIIVLYPKPTVWNSITLSVFNDNGKKLIEAFNDEEISQIIWEKYGYRTDINKENNKITDLELIIPSKITDTVSSLNMENYNKLIEYLGK